MFIVWYLWEHYPAYLRINGTLGQSKVIHSVLALPHAVFYSVSQSKLSSLHARLQVKQLTKCSAKFIHSARAPLFHNWTQLYTETLHAEWLRGEWAQAPSQVTVPRWKAQRPQGWIAPWTANSWGHTVLTGDNRKSPSNPQSSVVLENASQGPPSPGRWQRSVTTPCTRAHTRRTTHPSSMCYCSPTRVLPNAR